MKRSSKQRTPASTRRPAAKKTADRASPTRARADKPASTPGPEHRRRALSHAERPAEVSRDEAGIAARLVDALDVRLDDRAVSPHVHGFHSYPARMHPETARVLIETVCRSRDRIVDPFCGSGTVLVEARCAGRRATGVDANPLAVMLSRLKTRGFTDAELGALAKAAEEVAAHADARRTARAGPTRRYGPTDRELFEVHVLLELDGLRDGVRRQKKGPIRQALELVLSAILIKVSRQPGDTAHDRKSRRFAAGFAIKLFRNKAAELCERLAAFGALLPARSSAPRVLLGDARTLRGIDARSASAIVTSPPYPGVYDYIEHHAARLRWLGLEDSTLEDAEIGARRSGKTRPREAAREWEQALGTCLGAMRRVLVPGGRAALVVADSVLGGRAAFADEYVPRLAAHQGLSWIAGARQPRPHAHAASRQAFRGRGRYEHVLVFERS